MSIKIFVHAPYDQYVTANTRFWNASGIDVSLDATGMRVQTESLVSILIGGIAFQAPPDGGVAPAADANAVFNLFPTREAAMKRPDLTSSASSSCSSSRCAASRWARRSTSAG